MASSRKHGQDELWEAGTRKRRSGRSAANSTVTVYMGNLPTKATPEDVDCLLTECGLGPVLEVGVHGHVDVDGGQIVGVSGGSHALVTCSKAEDASTAVNWLNGTIDMDGNEIQIKWASHQDRHVGYYAKVSNVPPEIDWLGVTNHFRRAADHVCLKRWCGEAILRFETREER
ncbi:unnamed protein product, partial [Ectocarpus sp. 12 AP-2014]